MKFMILPIVLITMAMNSSQDLMKANYKAYLSTDKENWKQNVALANKLYTDNPSVDNLFNLAQTEFGLLNISMKDQDEDLFDDYVDNCEERLENLANSEKYGADAKALLSGLLGYKMAYSPWKGMTLGPKGTRLLNEAYEMNPDSPIVLKMLASNKYFTPSMWGGDVDKALSLFQKSTQGFEKSDTSDNWMYLDNLAWEGIILNEMGRELEAQEVFSKAAEIEPNFNWVTKVLLPQVTKN